MPSMLDFVEQAATLVSIVGCLLVITHFKLVGFELHICMIFL